MEGQHIRLRSIISSSSSHRRGINQGDTFPLIYAPILRAECVSTYMNAQAIPLKVLL